MRIAEIYYTRKISANDIMLINRMVFPCDASKAVYKCAAVDPPSHVMDIESLAPCDNISFPFVAKTMDEKVTWADFNNELDLWCYSNT